MTSLDRGDPVRLSARAAAVAPFLAMDVLSAAHAIERGGGRVLHMELGEPAAPTPMAVREAAMRYLATGSIAYTQALGRPSLRERIARHYLDTYGVALPAERIAVTTGSSGAFILAFLAAFDPGARVAIAAPGYPAYRNILDALGCEVVPIAVGAATRYVVDAAAIEAVHAERPLDGVLLMSPGNPSGTMMSRDKLCDVCATCDRLGLTFVSDEIYHGLTYERPADTAVAFSDRAIVVNSFSKYFCMTGWRVGWMVLPESLVRPVERLAQSLAISVPTLSQVAAEAAFEATAELEAVRAGYGRSRAVLLDALPRLGFRDIHPVDGAFYVYADCGAFTNNSVDFCRRLLDETGIAATPGVDFDRDRGQATLRLSFAGSEATVVSALEKLTAWLPASVPIKPDWA